MQNLNWEFPGPHGRIHLTAVPLMLCVLGHLAQWLLTKLRSWVHPFVWGAI